jgi:Thaumatin family
VDIPIAWENTKCPENAPEDCKPNGPRFWARTGCRYDIAHNFAQCETGACEGPYDCGKQAEKGLGTVGTPPVSIVEWTFNAVNAQGYVYPDISLVDGVSLTVDVQALGKHCAEKPGAPTEPNWLSQNQPLAIHGSDLREATRCIDSYQLKRKDLSFFVRGEKGSNPDDVVACFTNCGRYEYGGTPAGNCKYDPTNPKCYYWKTFCCFAPPGDPDHIYGGKCTADSQCGQKGGCWQQPPLTPPKGPQVCACRAYIKDKTCAPNVCTHPYDEVPSAQPPFGHCSDVTGDANACIGDDTVHKVFPGGYTWPNDPQTYVSDARVYRVIFAPGGTTVPITDAGPIPFCSTLPDLYAYSAQVKQCAGDIGNGALFAGAKPGVKCTKVNDPVCMPDNGSCNITTGYCANWACKIADGIATHDVLCRWGTAPSPTVTPTPTPTPKGSPTPTPSPAASGTRTPTPTPTAKAAISAVCGASAQGSDSDSYKTLTIPVCKGTSGYVYIASISSYSATPITAPTGWTRSLKPHSH